MVTFASTADPQAYIESRNSGRAAIGRLLAGIREVREGSDSGGSNARLNSTLIVINDINQNGWRQWGAGAGASNVYFLAKYQQTPFAAAVQPNSWWVDIYFNFGLYVMLVTMALLAIALFRMRRQLGVSLVLISFSLASLVNSAQGDKMYQFGVLTITLFVFGWDASLGPASRTKGDRRRIRAS